VYVIGLLTTPMIGGLFTSANVSAQIESGPYRSAPAINSNDFASSRDDRGPTREQRIYFDFVGIGVLGAPFCASGVTRTAKKFVGGNRVASQVTQRFCRDSQGRTRVEHEASLEGPAAITIHDISAGVRYNLNPEDRTASQFAITGWEASTTMSPVDAPLPELLPLSPSHAVQRLPGLPLLPASRKPVATALGERSIDGLKAIGSRVEEVIPAGEMGNERPIVVSSEAWFSPELGVIIRNVHQNAMGIEVNYQLENIVRTEPDRTKFTIPSGYTTGALNEWMIAPSKPAPTPPPSERASADPSATLAAIDPYAPTFRTYERANVVGAPYSGVGVTKSVRTLPDGNRIVVTYSQRYFRDGQGRTRTEREMPDRASGERKQYQMVEVHDPVAGRRFVLFPERRGVSMGLDSDRKWGPPRLQPPLPGPDPESLLPYPPIGLGNNLDMVLLQSAYAADVATQRTSLGEKLIDGVRAIGTRAERRIPASKTGHERPVEIRTEAWFSTDLGVVIRITHRNSLGLDTSYQLEQLLLTEPDPALFQVPDDYRREINTIPPILPRRPPAASPDTPSQPGAAVPRN
jgi:hypothetical protein